ncbi:type VI secretion system-associated FHA domain protein TagH [Erwinia pyrifoliae]|uniref:type VI secretion system-associated FHA domain protein TagH n=1 Tax=Erwinia pyrifoliae TaxID=79967 RepID=UPI0001960EEB|nr:type VI secretion system-associated FHA domain protein TagH [Erwinia pyrifoliae]AUX73786.1 type VI secretion system-associated FHA domain protein TagH [Erwinia pyrifoliae]MCA8875894.1 type VI secretion system-associated FHA domain protein TagH [Erwinia pyrifoliae]CAX54408.1 Type VI secretion system, FHA domain-containing protein [Erwinia pyrifoliae Ep1/96]CAY73024.1 COG3456: putative type VI secretion system,core protein [Erwinia pyrifoliae DSM 12163]
MRFTIITSKQGQQPPQGSCDFLPPGGTIGRGADNNLVLPDDDRTISRLQAIVHISATGECHITNRGNVTRVHLNDIPLERGRQVELQDGDIIGIDDYRLQVSELSAGAQPLSQPVPAPAAPRPQPVAPAAAAAPAAIPSEIWDSLAQEFSISDNLSSRSKAKPQSQANPLTAPAAAERNPADPLAQLAQNSDPLNLERRDRTPDRLFNQDPLFKQDSIFDDSTPSTLFQPPGAKSSVTQGARQDEQDPLALFGAGAAPQVDRDDPLGLMMGSAVPLTPPEDKPQQTSEQPIIPLTPEPVPPVTGEKTSSSADELPDSDFSLFGDDKTQQSDEANSPLFDVPPPGPAAAQPTASSASGDYGGITLPTPQARARSSTPPPKGRLSIDPVANSTAHSSGSSGEVLDGDLMAALVGGMGLQDLQPTPRFDQHAMQELGQMLSMFSQGTVALLSSRSILKRGVKAEMTVILDEANNPFKLLPSGKSVLMQMFGSRMPGFMPPKQSVRDALVDLQAHQLGMIAGIRALIASMLQSFNPQQLEEEARQEGAISRLSLPGSRKAALWDHFSKRYSETAGEIEDDFHTLFGEAFLHAYDMEVNQYKDSQIRSEER